MKYNCPDILKERRLISLDIETTGLNTMINTIIQMGVIEFDCGVEKLSYERLFGGGHSPLYLVRRLHKISNESRVGKSTFKESGEKIASYLSNAIIVTHNGNRFDIPFISRVLSEGGFEIMNSTYVDTLILSRKFDDHLFHSLEWLSGHYGLKYDESNHTGLADARNTLELLFAFLEKRPDLSSYIK